MFFILCACQLVEECRIKWKEHEKGCCVFFWRGLNACHHQIKWQYHGTCCALSCRLALSRQTANCARRTHFIYHDYIVPLDRHCHTLYHVFPPTGAKSPVYQTSTVGGITMMHYRKPAVCQCNTQLHALRQHENGACRFWMEYHCNNTHEWFAFHTDLACVFVSQVCTFTFVCSCFCLFLLFCINGLANTPGLNCTDGTDNAGQSHAASVARKVGGIGWAYSRMCLGVHKQ